MYSNRLDADLAQILNTGPDRQSKHCQSYSKGKIESRNGGIAISAKHSAKQSNTAHTRIESSRAIRRDNSLMGLKKVDACSSKKPLINPQAQKDGSVARSNKSKNHQSKSTFIIAGNYKRVKDNCVSSYQVSNSEIGF